MSARVVVLASGTGTLMQALLDAQDAAYSIVALVCDVPDAQALDRAAAAGIPTTVVRPADFPDREAWNAGLAAAVEAHAPDWVVCAGFMRVLGSAFLTAFPQRIVNSHPALLPSFPGAHGVRDALAYGVRITGCTVHMVDDGVDTGPIIAQRAVEVLDSDDEASLHERIKVVERELLVDVVRRLSVGVTRITGRRVTIHE